MQMCSLPFSDFNIAIEICKYRLAKMTQQYISKKLTWPEKKS